MGKLNPVHVSELSLPPGFRFFPTDEELLVDYLCRKVAGQHFSLQIIGEVDLYKFEPWLLPDKALFGEKEWYFFSPRDRKYPNGSRPNRVAGSGYWKATGTDKIITAQGRRVGIKKALVFYVGKAPKGSKTNWIMHEYRLCEPTRKEGSVRLDDWVLCRIYNKRSGTHKPMLAKEEISKEYSSSTSYLEGVLDCHPDIDYRYSDLPLMNSLKSLEDDKLNLQNLGPGKFDWNAPVWPNGQTYRPSTDSCFPTVPSLCHVESPMEVIGSSIEDEMESDLYQQQEKQRQPSIYNWMDQIMAAYSTLPAPCSFGD